MSGLVCLMLVWSGLVYLILVWSGLILVWSGLSNASFVVEVLAVYLPHPTPSGLACLMPVLSCLFNENVIVGGTL